MIIVAEVVAEERGGRMPVFAVRGVDGQLGIVAARVYIEIAGGDHSLFISKNRGSMSKVFTFFDVVRKSQRPPRN